MPIQKVHARLDLFPVDIVVCDYVQKASIAFNESDNRHQAVSRTFSEWYDVALRHSCHTLVLSQITRAVEKQKRREPVMEELKESGDLEAFADNILLLWWKWRETLSGEDQKNHYRIIVAKTKLGEPRRIDLHINPETLQLFS